MVFKLAVSIKYLLKNILQLSRHFLDVSMMNKIV